MARVETLLDTWNVNKVGKGFGLAYGQLLKGLGCVVGPINKGLAKVLRTTSVGKRTGPILDTALGVAAVLFSYITEATDIEQDGNYFAVTLLTGRAVFSLTGFMLFVLGVAQLAALIGETVPGIPKFELFSDSYKEYTSSLKHGLISLMLVSISLIMSADNDDGQISWRGGGGNESIWLFFVILTITALVSRWFSELEHGVVSRQFGEFGFKDGQAVIFNELKPEYRFKHARGPALLVTTGLFLYMRVHSTVDGVEEWFRDSTVSLLLAIYAVVVVLERFQKANTELVIGEESGLVVTGVITTLMLYFAGIDLATKKTQESVFVTLGVIMLDAMRVGYGMKAPRESEIQNWRAAVYRLFQILVGVMSFLYVTKTETDQHAATTPILFGVALAAALTKVLGISYISKDMLLSGSEHFFRSLASTGLLLTSAYLWSHPLDSAKKDTGAVLFFILGMASRLLDSVQDFRLGGGRTLAAYIAWDDNKDKVNSATVDNPRTWLTTIALVVSLSFASMAMHEKWDIIEVDGKATRNDELGDSMITDVFFIALHVFVVGFVFIRAIAGDKVSDKVNMMLEFLQLSKSRFIRFAVTTTVLSALAAAAGSVGFEGTTAIGSGGVQSQLLTSLIAYVFADTVGRELL